MLKCAATNRFMHRIINFTCRFFSITSYADLCLKLIKNITVFNCIYKKIIWNFDETNRFMQKIINLSCRFCFKHIFCRILAEISLKLIKNKTLFAALIKIMNVKCDATKRFLYNIIKLGYVIFSKNIFVKNKL